MRAALQGLLPHRTTHAGLWLDRFLPAHDKTKAEGEAKGARQDHIKRALRALEVPAPYREHFGRWRAHFEQLQERDSATCASAEVHGRMAVGLGAASVLEVSIALHHTFGTPLIPGSALKGLAASYARRRLLDEAWRPSGPSFRALFGDHTEASCVAFHDALWIPERDTALPLDLDVMAVHHAKYYMTQERPPPPADSDDPTPVPFVTARGSYLIVIEGPPQWTDVAMGILKLALLEDGIGAKTAAGYGRLELVYRSAAQQEKEAIQAELAAVDAQELRLSQLLDNLVIQNIGAQLQQIFALTSPTQRKRVAERCAKTLGKKALKTARKKNAKWVMQLTRALEGAPPEEAEA